MKVAMAPSGKRQSLGEVLVSIGAITVAQLNEAARKSDPSQLTLGSALIELRYATEEKLLKAMCIRLGAPYFATFDGFLDQEVASRLVPERTARRLLVLPLFRLEDSLTLAMVNPVDRHAIVEVSRLTELKVRPVVTSIENLLQSIAKVHGRMIKQ